MRPFILAAALLLPLPALAAEGFVQALYEGQPLCLIASVEGDSMTPVGDSDSEAPAELGPRDWSVATLDGLVAQAKGAAPAIGECACLELPQVSLAPPPDVAGAALASNLPLGLPSKLERLSADSPAYVKAARDWLDHLGLTAAPVRLTQVIRTDLEGDGVDEVLLAGAYNNIVVADADLKVGRYAFLLLRKLVDGRVVTSLVDGYFDPLPYAQEQTIDGWSSVDVIAVVDLDGDGVAEVAVTVGTWEGIDYGVYRLQGSALLQQANCGCGC